MQTTAQSAAMRLLFCFNSPAQRYYCPQTNRCNLKHRRVPTNHTAEILGRRGSIPNPIRHGPLCGNTSCVEVRADPDHYSDAAQAASLGLELVAEFDHQPIELTLLLTHTIGPHSRLHFFCQCTNLAISCASWLRRGAPWSGKTC